MGKKGRVAQSFGQSRSDNGMKMAEVTLEKFDPTYEVEMLAMCSQREAVLARLKEIERQYLGKSQVFPILDFISTLLALRTASLDVIESVIRWRGRLVNREPVLWREKDGSYVNYLLKLLRDTERHLRTFDLPRSMGLTFGQRNPFLLPLFPAHFDSRDYVVGKSGKKLVTATNVIRHDLLLAHARSALGHSHSLVPTDIPRLWWTSNVEFRQQVFKLLRGLSDLGSDPALLVRIAEGHQYLKQEEMASNKKSHHHKASQKTAHFQSTSPYVDEEELSDTWGFDGWVKMPWSPGIDPDLVHGPAPRIETVLSTESFDEAEAVEVTNTTKPIMTRKERAAAAAAAAEELRKSRPTVDMLASRSLEERWNETLSQRGDKIPTTFVAKTNCPPSKTEPWWGAKAPSMDDHLFATAHERSIEERKFAPTIRGEMDGEGDALETGQVVAFPAIVRRPGEPLPPNLVAADHITRTKRTDQFSVLNKATQLAEEAAAEVDKAANHAELEAAAVIMAKKAAEPKEDLKRSASIKPGSPKKEMSLFEKQKEKDRLKARRKDALRCEKEKLAREARFRFERKKAYTNKFHNTVRNAVYDQHSDLLRVLSHCEDVAPTHITAVAAVGELKKKSS